MSKKGSKSEFRPSREDKIKEWGQAIQAALRDRDGAVIADDKAADYAERFWESLERRHMPIINIMDVTGSRAVKWVLFAYCGALINAAVTKEPRSPS